MDEPNEYDEPSQGEMTDEDIREAQLADAKRRMMQLDALAGRLEQDLRENLGIRETIEERWLEDLRQYNGEYSETTLANIRAREGSEVYINITRPKVHTGEARLSDLLFPSDDKNWAFRPTPVARMAQALKDESPAMGEDGQPTTVRDAARALQEEAEEKCRAMELEVEDQLREANYNEECRMAIHDACVLGTGVLVGPIVTGRTRKAWEPGYNGYQLNVTDDPRPDVYRVSPWNFVPDMSAATIKDARFGFIRNYLHFPAMRELANDPYYMAPQVIRAIKAGPKASHISDRHPTNEQRDSANGRRDGAQETRQDAFEVWTYHGPITVAELRAAGVDLEDEEDPLFAELGDEAEVQGCVVFCNGIVLKAYRDPMDRGELPISIFTYERDEACIFGFGIPYRMRNQQATLNAAWRALMDNTGLTVLPQLLINRGLVEPADGDWRLKSGKTWYLTDRMRNVREVMATFDIPSHQAELQQVIELSRRFIDDETNLPLITQGDQGTHITQTAQGMSMLMNAANVVTRLLVKNWDDGITKTMLRRFYDWNMQYSDRDDIKGDFEVDARGSTVMMAREIESQNLMLLATQFAPNPIFGPMIKADKLLARIARAVNIPVGDVIKSEEEIEAEQQAMAEQEPEQDPEVALAQFKHEAEMNLLQAKEQAAQQMEMIRQQGRLQEAAMERELQIMRMATEREMSIEQLRAELAKVQISEDGAQTRQLREAAIKQRFGSGL